MSRSVLLQLARDSIEEVLQAQNNIDKEALLEEHPLLGQKIPTTVEIFVENELRGAYSSSQTPRSLLYEIIINTKKAAFEDEAFTPMSTAEYLSCEIELTLQTPDGVISQRDEAILASV